MEEAMDSHIEEDLCKVVCMTQWNGYKREDDWMEEPFDSFIEIEYLRTFHSKYPRKLMDDGLEGIYDLNFIHLGFETLC
jgi:hypothetical protein